MFSINNEENDDVVEKSKLLSQYSYLIDDRNDLGQKANIKPVGDLSPDLKGEEEDEDPLQQSIFDQSDSSFEHDGEDIEEKAKAEIPFMQSKIGAFINHTISQQLLVDITKGKICLSKLEQMSLTHPLDMVILCLLT